MKPAARQSRRSDTPLGLPRHQRCSSSIPQRLLDTAPPGSSHVLVVKMVWGSLPAAHRPRTNGGSRRGGRAPLLRQQIILGVVRSGSARGARPVLHQHHREVVVEFVGGVFEDGTHQPAQRLGGRQVGQQVTGQQVREPLQTEPLGATPSTFNDAVGV